MRYLLLLMLAGCATGIPDNTTWTAIDSHGNIHTGLKDKRSYDTATVFIDKSGKIVVFKGDHSYREE